MFPFSYFTYGVKNIHKLTRNAYSYSEERVTLYLSFTWRLLKEIYLMLSF